jgi:hypothetical protein
MKITDPQFGELTFDERIKWWEGRVTISAGTFELYIHTPRENSDAITDNARITFKQIEDLEKAAKEFSAADLLKVFNTTWNDGDAITASEFMKRLKPSAIQLWPNGNAEISYGDGGLFEGHEIGARYRGGKFIEAVVQG